MTDHTKKFCSNFELWCIGGLSRLIDVLLNLEDIKNNRDAIMQPGKEKEQEHLVLKHYVILFISDIF